MIHKAFEIALFQALVQLVIATMVLGFAVVAGVEVKGNFGLGDPDAWAKSLATVCGAVAGAYVYLRFRGNA